MGSHEVLRNSSADDWLSYTINSDDQIIATSGNWDHFAVSNGASELVGDRIRGGSFWNHIYGSTLLIVYRELLRCVRSGKHLQFDFRCDSAHERRFMHLSMCGFADGSVRFETHSLRIEQRDELTFDLISNESRDEMIVMCSWCKKVCTGQNSWDELESAIEKLRILERSVPPGITHGLCWSCYKKAMTSIAD